MTPKQHPERGTWTIDVNPPLGIPGRLDGATLGVLQEPVEERRLPKRAGARGVQHATNVHGDQGRHHTDGHPPSTLDSGCLLELQSGWAEIA